MKNSRNPKSADKVESLLREPVVEIVGQRRLLIEHHHGVLGYSLEEVCVRVEFGSIRILGCDLRIMQLSKEQLVICGRIDAVQMFGR